MNRKQKIAALQAISEGKAPIHSLIPFYNPYAQKTDAELLDLLKNEYAIWMQSGCPENEILIPYFKTFLL